MSANGEKIRHTRINNRNQPVAAFLKFAHLYFFANANLKF